MKRLLCINTLLLLGLTLACRATSRPPDTPINTLTPMHLATLTLSNSRMTTSTVMPCDSTDNHQLIVSGLEVYRSQYCGLCHVLDSAETGGLFGPTHNAMGATAEQRIRDPKYTGMTTTAEGYIRESIIDPAIYIVPGYGQTRFSMPAYSNLSEACVNALVQLLLQET